MSRREWWWCRFHDRLNSRGTWITVITFAFPGIGVLVAQAVGADPWTFWLGVSLFCVPLFYVMFLAWQTYPPSLNPQEVAGRKLTLTELQKLPPECIKVALVGVGFVGKTTLLEHLAALPQTNAQTVSPEMVIFHTPAPVKSLVYLDAAGEDLTQQFEIMNHADILVLLLDHNRGGSAGVSKDRKSLQGHNVDNFVAKIRQRHREGKAVLAVHVLRNKHDLWSQCPTAQMQNLLTWFAQQLDKVRGVMPVGTVSDADHSNERAADIAMVRERIMALAVWVIQQRAH